MVRWAMGSVREMIAACEGYGSCCVRLFVGERLFAAQHVQRCSSAKAVVAVSVDEGHQGAATPLWRRSRPQRVDSALQYGLMRLPPVFGEKRGAAN